MLTSSLYLLAGIVLFLALAFVLFYLFCYAFYSKHIDRIFQTKPLLLADQGEPLTPNETIEAKTTDGRRIEGSYLPHRGPSRLGVVLFLHEYGATRWMAGPYADHLRDLGFDLFTFDFGSCGVSEGVLGYEPLQWPTEHELRDARAAVEALREKNRLDQPLLLYGVSKGGGVALALAAEEPAVRAVVTDGAFPVHSMVTHYSMKFIEIYSTSRFIYRILPFWFYGTIVHFALKRVERERGVRYLPLEKLAGQTTGKPLLMIRGEKDNYVNEEIVRRFFACAAEPKELWTVPRAKHNQCLNREGDNYRSRIAEFLKSAASTN